MKLIKKFLGIAVIFTVIGFMVLPLTGCPEEDNSSSSSQTGAGEENNLDRWIDGSITTAGGEQWFKFTATAETHYIHFQPGTLTDVYVQLYEDDRETTKGNRVNLYSANTSTRQESLTVNSEYYIKVTPFTATNSGTYKIGVTLTSFSPILLTVPTTSAIQLTADTWTDGSITTADGEQWFKFTATAETHYIHFLQGTLTNVYVQLYTNDGRSSQSRAYLSSGTNTSRTSLTVNNVYYIRVTTSSTTGSGTYKIAFGMTNSAPAITLPTDVTELTADTWTDGSISAASGEQWFKFKATETTHYIHFLPGTLTYITVQLYTDDGRSSWNANSFSSSTTNASRSSLTVNSDYYIKVTPQSSYFSYIGTYKIGFNSTNLSPTITLPTGVTPLTADTWTDGSISTAGGEQWFKFTATAATHYIHFQPGTLTSVYVQQYTNDGISSWSKTNLSSSGTPSTSRTSLTANNVYYIRVTPYSATGSGAYKIAFNSTLASPPSITVPTEGVTQLTANTWADGSISAAGGEQWFKFTATTATHYIYFLSGTLTSINVQLYTYDGRISGGSISNLYNSDLKQLTSGNVYYIKVTPNQSTYSGAYKIAFGTTNSAPAITLPTDATELTADTWADGSIATAGGEQWFKFTATAAIHYIYFQPGTLSDVYVQLYKDDGKSSENRTNLYGFTLYTSRSSLTVNSEYYIKVTPYSSSYSGAYKIGFGTTSTLPN